ncbi:ATP-binding protein [Dongia sp.]|uniref:sensor histidine kinase n=1 Tax=Dongia sp. TaxID=1977262 RepID=UPI0035B2DF6C
MFTRSKQWLAARLSRQLLAALAISVFLIGAPAGLLLYFFSERWAIEDAKRIIVSVQEGKEREIEQALATADPSLLKLTAFIETAMQAPPSPSDSDALRKLVVPFPDGSWRSDPAHFDGRLHAGIYIDPNTERTPFTDAFHARLQPIVDLYGAGTVPRFDTLWVLTRWHSSIVLMPRVPTYVWDATPDDDYNETDWIKGADPAVNPTRALYWTKPTYDTVARSWMVSAVRPLDINGAWIGTIGHDFFLAGLFERLSGDQTFAGAEDFLVDANGDYMLAGRWQNAIESAAFGNADKTRIDGLLAPIWKKLGPISDAKAVSATFDGQPVLASVAKIAGPDWTLLHVVPQESIAGRLSDAFLGSAIVTLLAFLLVAAAIHGLMQRRVVEPLRYMADTVQHFESGDDNSRIRMPRSDEIGRLAAAFNIMAEKMGKSRRKLEKARAELESRNRELQRANRTKSNVLANMSHEFRTPLNAILGFSDILQMQLYGQLGDARYVEYVGHIHSSGKHLLELINDILDLTKIEEEKMELKFEDYDVLPLIDGCLAMVRPAANTQGVTLNGPIDQTPVTINCDRRAVNQMLLNLLSNAIRHTPAKGSVSVTLERLPEGGAALIVTDTGSGIPDKLLPLLFSPFGIRSAQTAEQNPSQRGGTGLGLSITRGLIHLHGGEVKLETKVGKGTQMTLIFPPERVRTPMPETTRPLATASI